MSYEEYLQEIKDADRSATLNELIEAIMDDSLKPKERKKLIDRAKAKLKTF